MAYLFVEHEVESLAHFISKATYHNTCTQINSTFLTLPKYLIAKYMVWNWQFLEYVYV